MLAVTIIMILGFGIFCIYGSNDMRSKTENTLYAWFIALFIFVCSVGCVLLIYESAYYSGLIKQEKKEIVLERQIQIDTSYFIKKLK